MTPPPRGRAPITALGLALITYRGLRGYLPLFKTIYSPNVLVSVAHITFRDADRPDCAILPPSMASYRRDLRRTYFNTLDNFIQHLEDPVRERIRSSGAVSFTMKARWYRPRHPDPAVTDAGNFSLFHRCTNFQGEQDVSPSVACQASPVAFRRNYYYDGRYYASLTFDKQLQRTLVLETPENLQTKLCWVKFQYVPLNFSFAVYDVDYDDGPGCPSLSINGPYRRLNLLQRILNYFKEDYTTENECNRFFNP
ncbi:uncharacterized protein LOC144097440 [Amblyomma americanum]